MIFYAGANVLMEMKFSKYNNLTIMVCYAAVIFIVAATVRRMVYVEGAGFEFPTGTALALVIVLGLLFAFADYFYIGAYTNGGNLITVTTITVMFPVFASLLKFALTRSLPNIWQVAGYITAAVAVVLVTKGNMIK